MLLGIQAASEIKIGDYTYYYNLNTDRKTVDLYRDNIPGLAWWIYWPAIDPSPVGELPIPEEIAVTPSNRYTVVNLGQESFKGLDNMTSVVILLKKLFCRRGLFRLGRLHLADARR